MNLSASLEKEFQFFKTPKMKGGCVMKEFLRWSIGNGGFGTPFSNLIFGITFVKVGFMSPMMYFLAACGMCLFLCLIIQVLFYGLLQLIDEKE